MTSNGPESDSASAQGRSADARLDAAPVLGPNQAEELTDKLIDKREKLQYFIITASTAVIVFSFNDFNKAQGTLRHGPLNLIMGGWIVLLLASAFSLYALRARQWVYGRAIDEIRGTDPLKEEDKTRIGKVQTRIRWAGNLMSACFVGGVTLLAFAYVFALRSVERG
jgi:hypothetical protein